MDRAVPVAFALGVGLGLCGLLLHGASGTSEDPTPAGSASPSPPVVTAGVPPTLQGMPRRAPAASSEVPASKELPLVERDAATHFNIRILTSRSMQLGDTPTDPVLEGLLRDLDSAYPADAAGEGPSGGDLAARLRSSDSRQVLLALAEALRMRPPPLAALRAAVQDQSLGSYRAVALDQVVKLAPEEDWVRDALVAAAGGDDPLMRGVARRSLSASDQLALAARGGAESPSSGALVSAIVALDDEALGDAVALGSLWRIADSHQDPEVREHARERLARLEPGDSRQLQVLTATYGIDERRVDVRAQLGRRIVRDRLRVRASNELAGDPAFGVVKELVVSYEFQGRTWWRTVREGSELILP